jgi:hypothetical protein
VRKAAILLFFLGRLGLTEHAKAQIHDALAKPTEKLLAVHAEVVKQSYCHVDDESFVASLNVRLQFRNSSEHPVILSRKIEPPPIVRAARDLKSGENGDFLFASDIHSTVAELPNGPVFGDAPDMQLFVVLAPGEKFETTVRTGVFGADDAAKNKSGNGLLAKGSYVLQVGISTWPYEWPCSSQTHSAPRRCTRVPCNDEKLLPIGWRNCSAASGAHASSCRSRAQ